MIYQICDALMSISMIQIPLMSIYFEHSLTHQIGQLIDTSNDNIFLKSFE